MAGGFVTLTEAEIDLTSRDGGVGVLDVEASECPCGVAEVGLEEGLAGGGVSPGGDKAELMKSDVEGAVVLGESDSKKAGVEAAGDGVAG